MPSSAFSAISRPRRLAVQGRGRAERQASSGDGAGPSGLSAAYHLARLGHTVEIHEAGPLPGGMMHFGIPAYPLAARESDEGDPAHRGHGRQDRRQPQSRGRAGGKIVGNFDAVFIAIGAGVGKHIDIPARDAGRVLDAVSLLHKVKEGEPPRLGRRVIVSAGETRRWMRRAPPNAWAPTRR